METSVDPSEINRELRVSEAVDRTMTPVVTLGFSMPVFLISYLASLWYQVMSWYVLTLLFSLATVTIIQFTMRNRTLTLAKLKTTQGTTFRVEIPASPSKESVS